MNFTERFQRNLKRLRKTAGLTQDQLAQDLGVGRTTVASWEIGKFAPSPETFDALAKVFGCDVGEFFVPVGQEEFNRKLGEIHEAFVTIVDYTRAKLLEDLQVAKQPEKADIFKEALIKKVSPPPPLMDDKPDSNAI